LKQLAIKAAYLYADLKEKIYTKIPYGDKNFNTNKLWLLKKSSLWFKTNWKNVI